MKKGISFFIGLGLLVGNLAVPTMPTYAEGTPTSCEGLENCEVITTSEELVNFFTSFNDGPFVTREGKSTMIIGSNLSMTKDFYITDTDLTIYLGNYTIEANDMSFLFYDSTVVIEGEEGTLNNEGKVYSPLYLRENTVATINGGTIKGGDNEAAIIMDDGAKLTLNDGQVFGKTWVISAFNDTEIVMNGGEITTTGPDSIGISGNGTSDPTKSNYGGNAKFTLNGGIINSNDLGVYAPQVGGVTTLGENLTINAKKAGVEIRAGELVVNGSTINVNAETPYEFNPNGSGSTATGVAIAVAQHTTKQAISTTINSGTFTAPVAFAESNPQKNDDESIEKVTLEISGGSFNATNGDPIVASEDVEKFITGGEFNKLPDFKYVADGYEIYDKSPDGPFFVEDEIELQLPESVYLQIGETFDLENYLTDAAKEYITFSNAKESETTIASFDGETWKYTAEAKGTGIASYQLHNHINEEVDASIEFNIVSADDLEIVADENTNITEEELTIISEKIQEILANYNIGETEIWVDEEGSVWVVPEEVKKVIANDGSLIIEVFSEQISDEEIAKNTDQLAELIEENDTVVGIWDIEYVIRGLDDEIIGGIYELPEATILTFTIPKAMRTAPEGYERRFFVTRYHLDPYQGEQVDRIEAAFDGENAVIENDKFSVFIVTYQDEKVTEAPNTGRFTKTEGSSATEGKLNSAIVLLSAVMLLLGTRLMRLGFAGVARAKNSEK
ncbi:hypothetical protein IJ380_00460 [Candidatus Saccharibacteria bacterium]|nr:hypothetical protein [Candidatus Saccharibacteria bacterium]